MDYHSALIKKLKAEGYASAKFRGHIMGRFVPLSDESWQRATCKACGMEVDIMAFPRPNETDISGEAVALSCLKSS